MLQADTGQPACGRRTTILRQPNSIVPFTPSMWCFFLLRFIKGGGCCVSASVLCCCAMEQTLGPIIGTWNEHLHTPPINGITRYCWMYNSNAKHSLLRPSLAARIFAHTYVHACHGEVYSNYNLWLKCYMCYQQLHDLLRDWCPSILSTSTNTNAIYLHV